MQGGALLYKGGSEDKYEDYYGDSELRIFAFKGALSDPDVTAYLNLSAGSLAFSTVFTTALRTGE